MSIRKREVAEVVGVEWLSGGAGTIGFVLIEDPYDGLKCYAGVAHGESEEADSQLIRRLGAKVEAGIARAIFPYQFDEYEKRVHGGN